MERKDYFLFKYVDHDGVELIMRLPHTEYRISEVAEQFTYFLRGCGYQITDVLGEVE
jgi:hypothetical protein